MGNDFFGLIDSEKSLNGSLSYYSFDLLPEDLVGQSVKYFF
jgi:hypothetical protein